MQKKLAKKFCLNMHCIQDDEIETVVPVVPNPGSTQEVTDVSDQAKYKGLAAFMRPAAMVLMAAGTAGWGAAAAIYLQSGNPAKSEENHSNVKGDIRNGAKNADPSYAEFLADGSSPDPGRKQQETNDDAFSTGGDDHRASVDDPFSEDALGVSNAPNVPEVASRKKSGDAFPEAVVSDKPVRSDDASKADESDKESRQSSLSESYAERKKELQGREQKSVESERSMELPSPSSPSREERATQQAVNLMALADEDLASGNYVQAMQAYQTLRQKSSGVSGVAILFRLALCAEAAGRHAAAIEAYRKISGTQTDPAWTGVARYGEARCLSVMKRHTGLQSDLLRRAILDESEFLPTVRGEVLHLIGRDLWQQQTANDSDNLLDDSTLVVPVWSSDPARLLDELPLLLNETPTKSGPTEFHVVALDSSSPDGIIVRLNCGMTSVESLIRNMVVGCRLSCDISEAARETLNGRKLQIHVAEQSLALLLDGITISSGIAWQFKNSGVHVFHESELGADELRQSRLDAAERILRTSVMEAPGSFQAGHSRLALSTLLFEQNRAADALQFLQVQIESSPRSVVETEAAFNLGKCHMKLNQREEAIAAFLRSIDSSGGQLDVKIASYIFHSRVLLEDDRGKLAIQSMMRGLSLSAGSSMEPYAALQLASLYLMLQNPQGANAVLMERRDSLSEAGQQGAAFLSALSRFRAAVLADRKEREGAAVVAALAEFDASKYCGGHFAVLVAGACEELGLSQESTDAYLLALKKLPASDLRNKAILRLASHYEADKRLEEARLLLATLSSEEADQMTLQARLNNAELQLQELHPDEAITACRLLIDSTDEPHLERAALRIMGKAYELKKDHQSAISCFTGKLPNDETQVRVEPASAKNSTMPASSGGRK